MNDFIYHNPCKAYFGEGHLTDELGREVANHGRNVLLVTGGASAKVSGLYDGILSLLLASGYAVSELDGVAPNPRVGSVRDGVSLCRAHEVDVIVAVGGGSVMDCAKAVAAAVPYAGDPWDLMEDSSKVASALPVVCVPTTAATGSEMSGLAVVSNPETNEKLALASELIVPRVAFLQPSLTCSVPAFHTASGAAGTFAHVMESYFSVEPGLAMLDREAEGIMRTVAEHAPKALRHPKNLEARANLMWCASWSANGFLAGGRAKAWSLHPMGHELSAFFDVTHGAGLAVLMPTWMAFCLKRALKWYKSSDQTLERTALSILDTFYEYGVSVWGLSRTSSKVKTARKAIALTERFLYRRLRLPSRLRDLGVDRDSLADMAHAAVAHRGGLISGFVPLSEKDVRKIYRACW